MINLNSLHKSLTCEDYWMQVASNVRQETGANISLMLETQANTLREKIIELVSGFYHEKPIRWVEEVPYTAMSFWQRKRSEKSNWRLADHKGKNILEMSYANQDNHDGIVVITVENKMYVRLVNMGIHGLAKDLGLKISPKIIQMQ